MELKIRVIVLMVLLNVLYGFGQKKLVSVEVFCTASYCGGARPSDEMLAEITKPKPYVNKKMILLSEKGKAIKVKTNANGSFKIKLAEGNYKLMEFWRYKKLSPNGATLENFDKSCLAAEWEKEAIEVSVTKDKVLTTTKNEIILYCDWAYPCLLESHTPPLPQ